MSQSMSGWETELASGWIKFRSISSTVSLPTPTRTTAITTEDEPSLHYYSSSLTEFQRRKQANSSPFSTHQILFFPKLGIDILLHLLCLFFFLKHMVHLACRAKLTCWEVRLPRTEEEQDPQREEQSWEEEQSREEGRKKPRTQGWITTAKYTSTVLNCSGHEAYTHK